MLHYILSQSFEIVKVIICTKNYHILVNTYLTSRSFEMGTFPNKIKTDKIILKKNESTLVENYRLFDKFFFIMYEYAYLHKFKGFLSKCKILLPYKHKFV